MGGSLRQFEMGHGLSAYDRDRQVPNWRWEFGDGWLARIWESMSLSYVACRFVSGGVRGYT